MAAEVDLADELDTIQEMGHVVGIAGGKEHATLELLLGILDKVQKDEMLKKEADEFAQQVMEEERADCEMKAEREVEGKEELDQFEKAWVARARGKLQLTHTIEHRKLQTANLKSEKREDPSVLCTWRTTSTKDKTEIKEELKRDEGWAHWAED